VTEERDYSLEEAEDALIDADQEISPRAVGTARAALRHRTFRIVFIGAFSSNIGSWMQNVILGAYAYSISHSSVFVGLIFFAQLGPSLLLSMVGGLIADYVDRRRLLVAISLEQLAFSLLLALACRSQHPAHLTIFLLVLAIGIGQAIYAPTYSAMLPALVGREDLPGAISLNSAQMNASRVIGPAIGGLAYHAIGAPWVFAANAVTYLFVVAALLVVQLPPALSQLSHVRGLRQLTAGVRVARTDRVVGRALVTIFVFSLLSLPFIGLMPVTAAESFGLDPRSAGYGVLYACFGSGALLGAISVGTVLARTSRPLVVRVGMVGFAAALAAFALVRSPALAYPAVAVVGLFYFAMVTALSTAMQARLDDRVRGRVMALWIMGFGGTVALGNLLAGPIVAVIGIRPVLLGGAVVALALSWYADIREQPAASGLAIADA
jgi:MFS family permease